MQQIHVAVASLSLFEMNFYTPLYSCYQFKNPFNKTLKLSGIDCEDYLQRQLTSDVSALNQAEGQMSARLDRAGRVHSFFYLLRSTDCFYILANDEQSKQEFQSFLLRKLPVVATGVAMWTLPTPVNLLVSLPLLTLCLLLFLPKSSKNKIK